MMIIAVLNYLAIALAISMPIETNR